jgi:hypothetical protein
MFFSDPGFFHPDPKSRISDPTTTFFVAINLNVTKLKIIFLKLVQKNLSQLPKNMG